MGAAKRRTIPRLIMGEGRRRGRWDGVDSHLRELLTALYSDGEQFDATQADRLQRRRNLEPDAAEFLWWLVQATGARTVLEIGTSNGYSTIWLADALRQTGGRLVSVDTDPATQADAHTNLGEAGLADLVDLRVGDGGVELAKRADGELDLLFLDAERTEYPSWLPDMVRSVRVGGLIVVDNSISHASEVAPVRTSFDEDDRLVTTLLDVGKGELMAVKTAI